MIGIYSITNLINQKKYIGQSRNIENRWKEHRKSINSSDKYHYPLYRAIRKYGIENFSFQVIEQCKLEELDKREQYYIDKFNTIVPNGYNQTLGGTTTVPQKLDQQKVKEIIKMLENNFLSQEEIAQKFNVSQNTISDINSGYTWIQEDKIYPLRKYCNRSKIKSKKYYCIDCGKEISEGAVRCLICYKKYQQNNSLIPDREKLKELIFNFPFTKVGEMFGVSDNAIRKWCKKYNLPSKRKEISKYSKKEWDLI